MFYQQVGEGVDRADRILLQRVHLDDLGLQGAGEGRGGRGRALALAEDAADRGAARAVDQFGEAPCRGLLAVGLDGLLPQSVVARVVGIGGVVDDEVPDAAGGELGRRAPVERLQRVAQTRVVGLVLH